MCEHVQYCNAQTMYAISCQLNNSDLTWRHTIVVCDCVWASHRKMLINTILFTVVNGDCEYILEKQTGDNDQAYWQEYTFKYISLICLVLQVNLH